MLRSNVLQSKIWDRLYEIGRYINSLIWYTGYYVWNKEVNQTLAIKGVAQVGFSGHVKSYSKRILSKWCIIYSYHVKKFENKIWGNI